MNKNKTKSIFCLLLTIVGIIGVSIYLKSSRILDHMASIEAFKKYIEGYGEKAYIMFYIIQFISVIIAPIPSNISAVVGGTVFGLWKSFLISTLAIISGSIVVFILGRRFGRIFTNKFISSKISSKYERYFSSKKGELILVLLLFLPFLPDDAISFVAGLTKIKMGRYVMLMILTRPWEILDASAFGSLNIAIPLWGWGVISLFILYIVKNSDKIEKKLIVLLK